MPKLESTQIRADFPILLRQVRDNRPLIYLDSGASTQRPAQVLAAETEFINQHYGAVNRGAHQLAEEATDAYENAREVVAAFLGAQTSEIVWTMNATAALNTVAYGMLNASLPGASSESKVFALGPGDEIVVTQLEHHANLVPWQQLAMKTGATLKYIPVDAAGRLDYEQLESVITERAKVVAFTHVSNVTGTVTDVPAIVARAKAVGAFTVLDACQSVPHMGVNLGSLDVDFAAFSGHKIYGPTGIGAMYGRYELLEKLPVVTTGGSMVQLVDMEKSTFMAPPAKFEAGTQMVTQTVGLAAAVKYVQNIGMDNIFAHEVALATQFLDGLLEIPGITMVGPSDMVDRGGIIAFDVDQVHAHDTGQLLDAAGVAMRVGHHCAQPIHAHFGVRASVRASFGIYNTADEVETALGAVRNVREFFKL